MVQLSDLDDDCLLEMLDRVTPKELFKLQRLNKRVKRLADIKIGVKIKAIAIEEPKRHINTIFSLSTSSCSHLDSISPDQVLVFEPKIKNDFIILVDYYVPQFILSLLPKCFSVKTVDFGHRLLTYGMLLEVFQRCPRIECIKLIDLFLKPIEWDNLLDQIGHRIVHLAIEWRTDKTLKWFITSDHFLTTVAAKCHNIKRVDWVNENKPTSGLMAAFKLLPKDCWIRLACSKLPDDVVDVVDELNCRSLNWFQLEFRYDRLSKLKLNGVGGLSHDVVFAGLKRLEFNENYLISSQLIKYLLACRFPQLEEFHFNASVGYKDDEYEALFQRIETVKKLIIGCGKDCFIIKYPKLPQLAAINRLKNLETIYLVVLEIDGKWQSNDFLKQVEQYFDEIISLKKLTFDMRHRKNAVWDAAIEELVKRLKLKPSNVKVELK